MRFKIENLKNFTIVPNEYIRDKRISLKSKGLLSVMYSLPNDWDFTMAGLCKITNSGITTIRTIINELECFGYILREQTKNEKGQFDYIYHVYTNPKNKIFDNLKNSISVKRQMSANNGKEWHEKRNHRI